MMYMNVRFEGDISPENILSQFGLEEHGRVQQAIDTAVIEYMKPYWAWDTGRLANSAYSSDIGSGEIVYDTPYAWEMYEGRRANGEPVHYRTEHNPQAGPFPFERMIADHANDILQEAIQAARG